MDMNRITLHEWKDHYLDYYQGRPFNEGCARFIRKGIFELRTEDIDGMLETVDAAHLRKYMAMI